MLTDKLITVVIACYKDEGSIDLLLKRLEETMNKITPNWEAIFVNDASPDNAEQLLLRHAKINKRVTYTQLMGFYCSSGSTYCGCKMVSKKKIITYFF